MLRAALTNLIYPVLMHYQLWLSLVSSILGNIMTFIVVAAIKNMDSSPFVNVTILVGVAL